MWRYITLFLLAFLLLTGCINNDYNKISDSLLLTPNYSLPVGAQNSIAPKPLSSSDLSSIVVQDTIQYSLADLTDKREYIDWLMFRVGSLNSYPAQVSIAADYYDSSGNFLGSFTKTAPLIIPKPVVNELAGTTSQTQNQADFYLYATDIDLIMKMERIIITVTISDLTLSDALLSNWNNFRIYTSVGIQAQLHKQN